MSELSQDQTEKRKAIQKSATIWGVIVGGIAGLIAVWLLGSQGGAVRFGGAIVIALIIGFLVYRASFKSGAKSATCEKCGATYSRSRTDQKETLTGSEAKEEREEQADKSTKVTTWTEDTFEVVDTYTCAKCADTTTNTYQTTRRRDETTTTQPFEPPKDAANSRNAGATATKDGASEPTQRRRRARKPNT